VARGGDLTASNIIVSCGCNQETSVTHVLDYVGLHSAHRVTRLMALVTKLFFSRVPKPARRKMIAVYRENVLIEFVKRYYNPPKLTTYQQWLEADSDDLRRLAQPADEPSTTQPQPQLQPHPISPAPKHLPVANGSSSSL
jgi:hypothetical protein